MHRQALDSAILIQHWNAQPSGSLANWTNDDARKWADALIDRLNSDVILTPVYLEVVCGARTRDELALMEAYLSRFNVADRGRVLPEDWVEALRIARRIPRGGSRRAHGKRRQLGDCLIRAIANRLHYDVRETPDKHFPPR